MRFLFVHFAFALTAMGLVHKTQAARPLSKCHTYLSTFARPFDPAYQGHYHRANFNWEIFQLHMYELVNKYPEKFKLDVIGKSDGFDIYKITTRGNHQDPQKIRVLMTAGVHGDEPLTTSAALDVLAHYALEKDFSQKIEIVMYPAVNPWGLTNFNHRNRIGKDLYGGWTSRRPHATPKMIMKDLKFERFDLALDLHGAWPFTKHYVIRSKPDGGILDKAIKVIPPHERLPSWSGQYPGRNTPTGSYWMVSKGISQGDYGYGTIQYFLNSISRVGYTPEYPGVPKPESSHELNVRLVLSIISEVYAFKMRDQI